ncbi:MAG TPA: hypothetical protein PLV68_14535, partial [Ilumatobacteraceae bacterium]|nr:hypothetical protein [Ilumatobacteraceae bacterium]
LSTMGYALPGSVIAAGVLRIVKELADSGVTVLLVEEKPQQVLAIADRVALLRLGHVVWEGPRDELDEARIEDVYLGRAS